VDTEGSFVSHRVKDMAKALLKHLQRNLQQTCQRAGDGNGLVAQKQKDALAHFATVDDVLKRIHYCRVHNYTEQLAVVNSMSNVLKEHPNIRLLIIDSVAFHFRHDFDNMAKRTRLLSGHAQALNLLASKYSLAVVVTNQMTTKIKTDVGNKMNSVSYLVPALGESWSHAITSRVVLSQTEQTHRIKIKSKRRDHENGKDVYENITEDVIIRQASLVKSPSKQQKTISFIVVQAGIRQIPTKSKKRNEHQHTTASETSDSKKRKSS